MQNNNFQKLFWSVFWGLSFLPVTNSFLVNSGKFFQSFKANNMYKVSLNQLIDENNELKNKVKYYNSKSGFKALIKERLEKVDEGEILIKYSD